jgi:hypothetical protein
MASTSLKLPLAYKRVRDELIEQPKSGRAFVANTFEQELVEVDLAGWLAELGLMLAADTYSPEAIELCGAPKGGGLIRPGARLSLSDRVVYTAAVGSCIKEIVAATRWSQGRIDFAPLFDPKKAHQQRWLRSPFAGWKGWTERSLTRLDLSTTKYVVTIDIAGYFENINITLLQSELLRIGSATEPVSVIVRCLRHWAQVQDRGIPQGVMASDILAKLYLESFDKRLKDEGYTHVRYVDDVRIFCRTRSEARQALVFATELLRGRGLTVQTAKTTIRVADDLLRKEIEGAVPTIKALNREYIDEAIDAGVLLAADESVPVSVIDDLINAEPSKMDPEVIHRAFVTFVINTDKPNRSMFHYLLHRLAAAADHFAVEFCADYLRSDPNEAPEILRYFEDLDDARSLALPVVKALASRDVEMYPYTRFLMLGWLRRNCRTLSKPGLTIVRKHAFRPEHPDYVQGAARSVLGRVGDHSDLDQIASLVRSTVDPFKRAQLLCCLGRLEKGRRNALVSRVKGEQPWGARASALVKSTA